MAVARLASQNELLALVQGFARVWIKPLPSLPVDPEEVFAEVEEQSTKGTLHHIHDGLALADTVRLYDNSSYSAPFHAIGHLQSGVARKLVDPLPR